MQGKEFMQKDGWVQSVPTNLSRYSLSMKVVEEGDVIKCEKDIEHWHSSTKVSDVTYLALYGGVQPTTWTEVVTQQYYDEVAEKLLSN